MNGLAVVVPLWLEHATDMAGALQTKQCAAALLETLKLRHHPALAGASCQPGSSTGCRWHCFGMRAQAVAAMVASHATTCTGISTTQAALVCWLRTPAL